jgi:hypothetical protein
VILPGGTSSFPSSWRELAIARIETAKTAQRHSRRPSQSRSLMPWSAGRCASAFPCALVGSWRECAGWSRQSAQSSAEIEAELLQLDAQGAIDHVGAVASDVDDHIGGAVLQHAADSTSTSWAAAPPMTLRDEHLRRSASDLHCARSHVLGVCGCPQPACCVDDLVGLLRRDDQFHLELAVGHLPTVDQIGEV